MPARGLHFTGAKGVLGERLLDHMASTDHHAAGQSAADQQSATFAWVLFFVHTCPCACACRELVSSCLCVQLAPNPTLRNDTVSEAVVPSEDLSDVV